MRTATVVVTRRCTQACTFCDRVDHASIDPSPKSVYLAIEEALAEGASVIVLSGGEPTLRPELESFARFARDGGAEEVVLETNATLLATAEKVSSLRKAGITSARISLVTSAAEQHRSLVARAAPARATSPAHVFRGIAACLEAELPLTIRLPVARGLPPAAARLRGLAQAFPALRTFVLAVVRRGDRAATETALDPAELATELDLAYRAAQKERVELSVAADRPVPPCFGPFAEGARRLVGAALREEGPPNDACDACSRCALASRCRLGRSDLETSMDLDRVEPIREARTWLRPGKSPGSRLRVLGPADVETFFHVDYDYDTEVDTPTSRLGIIYRCNQICTFCELADMDTEVEPARVREAIDKSRARGSRRLIVTGGEPTLSPHLVDHLRYARDRGFEEIELQTNAVLLDRPGFAEALRDAGLTSAQVSMHGADAEVSDKLTAAPGTHRRTTAGVERLLEAGLRVLLNHLVFRDNCRGLVSFVDWVDARWARHKERIVIQFHSPRNEFADREEALAHVPRYAEYVPELRAAIDRARALGYAVRDLQDPTGVPALCVLGADPHYLGPLLAQSERPRFHAWESPWLTRVAACERCDVRDACMGVPRTYVTLHGEAEFSPIRRAESGELAVET